MDLGLSGKVALISGSTRGIGLSIAQTLEKEGVHVMINGRNSENVQNSLKYFSNAKGLAGDVTDENFCQNLVAETIKEFGKLDILVCNVGSGASVPPGKEDKKEFTKVLETNFYSAFNLIHEAKEELIKSVGSIVCISSICGHQFLGAPATYSSAKSMLNTYVKSLARPLGEDKVRINVVSPGNIYFEGSVWDRMIKENEEWVNNMLESQVSLKRFGRPEEIASTVAFLASEKASFITGTCVVADGGQLK